MTSPQGRVVADVPTSARRHRLADLPVAAAVALLGLVAGQKEIGVVIAFVAGATSAGRLCEANDQAANANRVTSSQAGLLCGSAAQLSRSIRVVVSGTGEVQQPIAEIAASAAQATTDGASTQVTRLGTASREIGEAARSAGSGADLVDRVEIQVRPQHVVAGCVCE